MACGYGKEELEKERAKIDALLRARGSTTTPNRYTPLQVHQVPHDDDKNSDPAQSIASTDSDAEGKAHSNTTACRDFVFTTHTNTNGHNTYDRDPNAHPDTNSHTHTNSEDESGSGTSLDSDFLETLINKEDPGNNPLALASSATGLNITGTNSTHPTTPSSTSTPLQKQPTHHPTKQHNKQELTSVQTSAHHTHPSISTTGPFAMDTGLTPAETPDTHLTITSSTSTPTQKQPTHHLTKPHNKQEFTFRADAPTFVPCNMHSTTKEIRTQPAKQPDKLHKQTTTHATSQPTTTHIPPKKQPTSAQSHTGGTHAT